MAYYTTKERIATFMRRWTDVNKRALKKKMEKQGITQGGFFKTDAENTALYDYLVDEVK